MLKMSLFLDFILFKETYKKNANECSRLSNLYAVTFLNISSLETFKKSNLKISLKNCG